MPAFQACCTERRYKRNTVLTFERRLKYIRCLMWAFAVIDAEGFRCNMEISWSILLAFTQTYPGRISSTAEPQRPYPLFAARAPCEGVALWAGRKPPYISTIAQRKILGKLAGNVPPAQLIKQHDNTQSLAFLKRVSVTSEHNFGKNTLLRGR